MTEPSLVDSSAACRSIHIATIPLPLKPDLLHDGRTNTDCQGSKYRVIGLLQRVSEASVEVDGRIIGRIGRGLLVLVAVHREDLPASIDRLAERIATYRVFPDGAGRMNRSLEDEGFGLLLVPQFTLAADTRKGTRASFTKAAAPEKGLEYFEKLLIACKKRLPQVEKGEFGANMQVSLVNDGPVTFWLDS